MQYRPFGNLPKGVSLLGFGAMRLPTSGKPTDIDYDRAKALVDAAYASGVNYFDTAYPYHGGASEPFLAKALAEYPRESYLLATKLPMWKVESAQDALDTFEEQLNNLKTDYVDFYLFHAMETKYVEKLEKLGLWELMDQKRKEGKIRHLGFSFHDEPEVLEGLCQKWQWDFAQIMYNYIDADFTHGQQQYDILEKHGIPCIIMEPVRGGRLANLGPAANGVLQKANPTASIASWAMRWLAPQKNILTILSGMNALSQLKDNLAVLSDPVPLSPAEEKALAEATEIFKSYSLIGCTGCEYCMPCPSGVNIPGMIALRNQCAFDANNFSLLQEYEAFPADKNAGNCTACLACEQVCPQHLPISDIMKKLCEDTAVEA
ncbi:aldo/keto reductase [Clostridia bacterium OttesenSCG-928-O13]|nr:aldo/keto reductase [Clostridia bacterium OttesenSCG-928-O13]